MIDRLDLLLAVLSILGATEGVTMEFRGVNWRGLMIELGGLLALMALVYRVAMS